MGGKKIVAAKRTRTWIIGKTPRILGEALGMEDREDEWWRGVSLGALCFLIVLEETQRRPTLDFLMVEDHPTEEET